MTYVVGVKLDSNKDSHTYDLTKILRFTCELVVVYKNTTEYTYNPLITNFDFLDTDSTITKIILHPYKDIFIDNLTWIKQEFTSNYYIPSSKFSDWLYVRIIRQTDMEFNIVAGCFTGIVIISPDDAGTIYEFTFFTDTIKYLKTCKKNGRLMNIDIENVEQCCS
jgi:hypothetical protein